MVPGTNPAGDARRQAAICATPTATRPAP